MIIESIIGNLNFTNRKNGSYQSLRQKILCSDYVAQKGLISFLNIIKPRTEALSVSYMMFKTQVLNVFYLKAIQK